MYLGVGFQIVLSFKFSNFKGWIYDYFDIIILMEIVFQLLFSVSLLFEDFKVFVYYYLFKCLRKVRFNVNYFFRLRKKERIVLSIRMRRLEWGILFIQSLGNLFYFIK